MRGVVLALAGLDRFGHSPAGMDAAKFHKVNEKIDLNDNKLREWVHSQRCVVEPPLQAVKCHGLPTTAL